MHTLFSLSRILFLACVMASFATEVHATEAQTTQNVRDACKHDVETYCDGVKRGKGRIKACLDEHRKELSNTCRSAMDEAKNACSADREKFCAGVKEGEGRIMECLKAHDDELSAECKAHSK